MSKKLTIDDIKDIAENRNHTIVSMEGYTDIKSKVQFFCIITITIEVVE